ncbi:MAG: glucose-6-phosphate isomerase, partial [Anaerolineae bacterium]
MSSFRHLKSFVRLHELAENPIDLTQEGVLSPKRVDAMIAEALGFQLFFSTERVDEVTLNSLFDLAEETKAVEKMHAMQNGEVINFIEGYESENRSVLHTAMRDFFEQRSTASLAQTASSLAYQELEKLKNFLNDIEAKNGFTDLVQIGIGGSELGPKAIYL